MTVTKPNQNGTAHRLAELDAAKLIITRALALKPLPAHNETLVFGVNTSDHMLVVNYDPVNGWSAPEAKPYGPLSFDPKSSCFHYCTNIFEGMKAYIGPHGEARLFRPEMNMARLARSAERVALPPFDTKQLLILIKSLIQIDARWIPKAPGYSLYVRPTIVGTQAALGVTASDSACLYVILSPAGPYFKQGISLLAVSDSVRSWPGGTGDHKLGLNYAPTFLPQKLAAKQGYDQVLWLLNERVTEVGAMNFFMATKRDDGEIDLITPPLDGTILPGITRDSTLQLVTAHTSGKIVLPGVDPTIKIYSCEREITMAQIVAFSKQGRILEAFGVGTAVVVASVSRIGWQEHDIVFPEYDAGLGPIGQGLWTMITDIQTGRKDFQGWSVCI